MAGYLASSTQLAIHQFPELQSPEDGPGHPDADQCQRRDEARPASSRPDQCREMGSDQRARPRTRADQTSVEMGSDQRARPRARTDGEPDYSLEQTGRNYSFFFLTFPPSQARSAHAWPALIGWTACRGSAFLQRTTPALIRSSPIDRKMTHSLIWRQARTKRFMSPRTARTIPRAVLLLALS